MKTFKLLAMLGASAALSVPAFGQLNLVTSRAAFPTTDAVDWSLLGAAFTHVPNGFTIATTGGSAVSVSHVLNKDFERRNEGNGWFGNFSTGEALLWNGGDNGSITFDPVNLVSGAGFNVQSDFPNTFVFRLDAYGIGGNLLGSVTESGSSDELLGTAIFIGFTSPFANVDKFIATLVQASDGPSDFAINGVVLSGPPGAEVFVPVPEPSTYGLIGALMVFGLIARERLRRHSEA